VKVHEALADRLQAAGIGAIFSLIGDESAEFVAESTQRGLRLFTGRHETGTVGMADGYARISGDIGIAVVARGPGLTNALTAIICASRAGSPVVVVAGDSSLKWRDRTPEEALAADRSHKYVPQEQILRAAMVHAETLTSPATAAADFAAILEQARTGETIVVNVPIDVMRADAGDGPPAITFESAVPASPEPERIRDLADALAEARLPVILAGRGAIRAGAIDALRSVGVATGALLATTLLAKGAFGDDPWCVGVAGGLGTPAGLEAIRSADVVLAVGTSLNPMTTYGGTVFPSARIIQVDRSSAAFGRHVVPDESVDGEAGAVAEALAAELRRRGTARTGARTPDVAARLADPGLRQRIVDRGEPGALDPRLVMLKLDEVLPRPRAVVVDSGRQLTFPSTYLSVTEPGSFVFPHDGGALGGAIGVGLGAAIARPDRVTVVCLGDGALMMSLADLDTAVRFELPMVFVVSNSAGFAGAAITLREAGLPDEPARYTNPPFEAVARGLGAAGMTVTTLDDLDDLPARLAEARGPLLVDCRTTSEVVPEWVEFIEQLHTANASV
jgi:thiamine pyrophosphate-dependent acetolactate synthase large subunit-like protein